MRERIKGKPSQPEPVSIADLEQYLLMGRLNPKERKQLPPNHEVSHGRVALRTQALGYPGRSFPPKATLQVLSLSPIKCFMFYLLIDQT